MPDLLITLERNWDAFAASPRGHRTLIRWQAAEPSLRSVVSLDALTAAARDIERVDLDARDELHHALLRIAANDQDARCAVLHLLHPALARIARIYSDTWDHDEASSLVVTAALRRVVHYPQGLARPAASIVRFVWRAMWKEAQHHHAVPRLLGRSTMLDDAIDVPADTERSSSEELLDLVDEALKAGVVDAAKARLVVLHRVFGVSTETVATEQGYPASTIRQRRNRAEAAIAAFVMEQVA